MASAEEKKAARCQLKQEGSLWWEARRWLLDQVFQRLGAPLPSLEGQGEARPEAILRVMALASFADWVASDPGLFPYGRDPLAPGYYEEARELAKKALDRLGWPAFAPAQKRGFRELFPHIPQPNALQEGVPALLEGAGSPVLLLVEAPMGMGKTEAALHAYYLLQAGLGHRGLYVALPTQATANGLFPRVRAFWSAWRKVAAWSSSFSMAPPSSTPITPSSWRRPRLSRCVMMPGKAQTRARRKQPGEGRASAGV